MARAGMMQAEVAWENILALIAASEGAESKKLNAVNKKSKLREYVPVMGMEGILKLSLGKVCFTSLLLKSSNLLAKCFFTVLGWLSYGCLLMRCPW